MGYALPPYTETVKTTQKLKKPLKRQPSEKWFRIYCTKSSSHECQLEPMAPYIWSLISNNPKRHFQLESDLLKSFEAGKDRRQQLYLIHAF